MRRILSSDMRVAIVLRGRPGLEKFRLVLLEDNDQEWSGDHCMDSRTVPGVLLSNQRLMNKNASLQDMSGTILRYFGIEPPPAMQKRNLL